MAATSVNTMSEINCESNGPEEARVPGQDSSPVIGDKTPVGVEKSGKSEVLDGSPSSSPLDTGETPAPGSKCDTKETPAPTAPKNSEGKEQPGVVGNGVIKGASEAEVDLIAEVVATANKEVEAATKDTSAQEGAQREASPAISEGSGEGEGAAAMEVVPQDSTPASAENTPTHERSKKSKRKEDKSIEHILKALNSLETSEEKLAALCKKYADLHEEHRLLRQKFKQGQHKLAAVLREKDQLQTEHSKAVLAKSKLESLCRELQRHNKLIKEESLARAREEEEKRKEVTNKFQTTINEIQQQMNDHYSKNGKLREENVELANKLKSLIEQYDLREQHIEKVLKHRDLEHQLMDARLQQANLKMTEEKEKSQQEKQILLAEAAEAHTKVQLLEEQEKALRAQVKLYTEKYEEFQQTLSKSNEVFSSFKVEMDKMTKKIKKLEKETHMWRQRWENSNRALLEMAEDKTRNDKENQMLQSKIQKLESLCRALQQQRHKAPASTPSEGPADGGEASGTKTPPNTPDVTHASPVTVQTGEGAASTADPGEGPSDPPAGQSQGGTAGDESGTGGKESGGKGEEETMVAEGKEKGVSEQQEEVVVEGEQSKDSSPVAASEKPEGEQGPSEDPVETGK